MNGEIKEILEDIKRIQKSDYDKLLDYITNLQQINKNLINSLNKKIDYKSRNDKAIDIAYEYSQIDGEHHKTWCIDQMVRALTADNYNEFVKEYENNGEYEWNIGIAP